MANGGFIGKRLVPTITSAKGVWTTNELYHARLDGIWTLLVAEVVTDFLIIGGGGGGGSGSPSAQSGGGAGGYLNSYGSEASGRNSTSLSTLTLEIFTNYAVTIGAGGAINTDGSNTSLTGTDVNGGSVSLTAIGGGRGGGYGSSQSAGGGNNGGSGGGGGDATSYGWVYGGSTIWTPGTGTSNQGFDGGAAKAEAGNVRFCEVMGASYCDYGTSAGGGGGGAGSAGTAADSGGAGGSGLASSITGSSVTRAAGGSGRGTENGNSAAMPTGSGSSSTGGGGEGGSSSNDGGNGIIILRTSSVFALSNPGGGLTFSTATDGSDNVFSITAGTGNIQFVAA